MENSNTLASACGHSLGGQDIVHSLMNCVVGDGKPYLTCDARADTERTPGGKINTYCTRRIQNRTIMNNLGRKVELSRALG